MGRGRIPMELIQKEKDRKTTFLKRKNGLMKKVYEFSTLCNVDVCVIIYGPNFDGQRFTEPETWPQDSKEVRRIIQKYRDTTSDRRARIYDVQEYYKDRVKKVEGEISKVHKEKLKIMYPTWDDSFNDLSEDQLRVFLSILDSKIVSCNQRINMLNQKGKTIMGVDSSSKDNNVNGGDLVVATNTTTTPYLSLLSNPSSHLNFMPNMSTQAQFFPHLNPMMTPFIGDTSQLPFYPLQLGQSSSQFDQNGMQFMGKNNGMVDYWEQQQVGTFGNHDIKFDLLKENGDGSNQNSSSSCYYKGNISLSSSSMQPYNSFIALPQYQDVPPDEFQVNGICDANMFDQVQMFNYMHGRK
ncbi:hypothetical protein PIB30_021473 [Stylosanthes scabra]|uniref:MADS-box domain-containing protein n=1 Tax=Stylosanthes scabra TaxID=79078 RepID=A0ABU6X725_9FABA|nr:hypothetical protein [Stylosanthes scabra]